MTQVVLRNTHATLRKTFLHQICLLIWKLEPAEPLRLKWATFFLNPAMKEGGVANPKWICCEKKLSSFLLGKFPSSSLRSQAASFQEWVEVQLRQPFMESVVWSFEIPNTKVTGWWFQRLFFSPYLRKWFPFWRAYVSKGLVQPPN